MARRWAQWVIIAFLHWPFCLSLAVIASTASTDQFKKSWPGKPADFTDDEDRVLQLINFVCVVAVGFGTVADLVDIIFSIVVLMTPKSRMKKLRILSPSLMNIFAPLMNLFTPLINLSAPRWMPPARAGYWIVSLRFIMLVLWVAALAWGLLPTNVLKYIDVDFADDFGDNQFPNYSASVIAIIGVILVLEFLSFIAPFVQRCVRYFCPQRSPSGPDLVEESNQPVDGHREIKLIGILRSQPVASTPIGHTRLVEYV